jgi:hypothetical protein
MAEGSAEMKCLTLWAVLLVVAGGFVGRARATPYWIDWEGTAWPEAVGFERNWGDAQGQYHGSGAVRTLEDGVLTYNSLFDPWVNDVYEMTRPGQMDPGPGETFVMEWRLKVDVVTGLFDPTVGAISDDAWGLSLAYAEDHICSVLDGMINIPIAPHVWHDYRVVSGDMRSYDLFVDGVLAHHGAFAHVITGSYVQFGDAWDPPSGVHHWDYFRFGVVSVPEPCALLSLMWVIAWRGARRG